MYEELGLDLSISKSENMWGQETGYAGRNLDSYYIIAGLYRKTVRPEVCGNSHFVQSTWLQTPTDLNDLLHPRSTLPLLNVYTTSTDKVSL